MNVKETVPEDMQTFVDVQEGCQEKLLSYENVVGVAIGQKEKNGTLTGESAITVLVTHKTDVAKENRVPGKVEGLTTDVQEVGEIFAGDLQPTTPDQVLEQQYRQEDWDAAEMADVQAAPFTARLTRRIRPACGGFSVGHVGITAGTLGTCCYDPIGLPSMPRGYYILSNNHVLANSNNARLGDPILQPGPADGGRAPRDIIARLRRFVPIRFHRGTSRPINLVDAAIAEGNLQDLDRKIHWGGHIKSLYRAPRVRDIVQKCGRTTGFTTGRVTNINATVDVNFGGGRVARFGRQIVTTVMSAPGDSGSVVLDLDERGVGLLFAGSATRTILNNLAYVQSLLGVRVTEK